MLCQHIVSTPWPQLNGDFVQQDGYGRTDVVIEVWHLPLEIGEGRFVTQGGMLSDVVVVIDIAPGLV